MTLNTPGTPKVPQPKRVPKRYPIWWFLLGSLILALVSWMIITFKQESNSPTVPTVSSVASAPAASEPEVVASAPEAVTPEPAPAPAPAPAPTELETYTVKPGDTLGRLFGKDAQAVCDLNDEILHGKCNMIKPDQVLKLPAGVTAREGRPARAEPGTETVKKAKPVRERKAQVAVQPVRAQSCITLGAAPFNPTHDLKRALEGIDLLKGLSPAQKEIAKRKYALGEKATENELIGQQIFKEMLYKSKVSKKAVHIYDKPICTPEQGGVPEVMDTYDLGDGVFLAMPRRCGNPSIFIRPPEVKVEPVPPVVVTEIPVEPAPEPADDPAPEPAPLPPVTAEAPKGFCDRWDPHLVVGQEHEPRHDGGDDAHSTFLTAALYCTWYDAKREGTHGIGIKALYSDYYGHVNNRTGKYAGHLGFIGPSYEFISDHGWDVEVAAMWGKYYGGFNQRDSEGEYRSQRYFDVVGLSAGANWYQRRLAGKEWFPETQVFGTIAKPLTRDVSHSWNGERIPNTDELSKFGTYLNLGVRQWIYETETSWVLPYAQLGYFLETPTSESLSARFGISDRYRRCGVGIGFDHDLKRGGDVAAWGWWCDGVKVLRVARADYRKYQMVTQLNSEGVEIKENRAGYIDSITIRFGGDTPPQVDLIKEPAASAEPSKL